VDYQQLQHPCVVGKHAVVVQGLQLRYLLNAPVGTLVSVDGVVDTPGAVARDYLRAVFGPEYRVPKRVVGRRWRRPWQLPYPYIPMYARPCTFEHGYYVDLQGFWFALVCRFGWNVAYSPGHYVGYGRPCDDFPFSSHKVARNALVSSAFPTRITLWSPQLGHQEVERKNPLLNVPLANLVSDVMHYVASIAVDCGAVYYYMDGAIVPDRASFERLARAYSDMGLRWRVKAEGPGWVDSPGSYRVGPVRSLKQLKPRPFSNLRPLEAAERRLLRKHLLDR
jgi:hypothetical protein